MSSLVKLCACAMLCAVAQSSLPALDYNYHNYTQLTAYLRQVELAYPDITTLYSIGQSAEKRELWVLEITSAKNTTLGVPNVKLIGNIHGNEPVGREVLLHLIEYLVRNHRDSETVKWLLDNTRIHLLISMNPDGFEVALAGMCKKGEGRINRNGFDLNRNFPDYFSPNSKPAQPEMLAIKQWMSKKQFTLSASLHGGALVANYPYDNTQQSIWETAISLLNTTNDDEEMKEIWRKINDIGLNYDESLTPDNDVFQHLAMLYAKTHPTMHSAEPCMEKLPRFQNGITNGAAWYPFPGGMQDYNYWTHGCMELTLELGCCKYPFPQELPQLWQDNRQALITYISQAQRGVRGVIRDNLTQLPIFEARLKISDRSMGFQSNQQGEFWRILLPGQYHLEVYKSGYEPLTIPFIVAEPTNPAQPIGNTWLDISMSAAQPRGVSRQRQLIVPLVTVVDTPIDYDVTTYQSDTTHDQPTISTNTREHRESEARTLTNNGGGVRPTSCTMLILFSIAVVPYNICMFL